MSHDPIRVRRARLARLATVGQRVGYGLVLLAVGTFGVGLVAGFGPAVTTIVSTALVATALTLAPSLVLGYSVRAAEREDRRGRQ